jgi:hypothetical protein
MWSNFPKIMKQGFNHKELTQEVKLTIHFSWFRINPKTGRSLKAEMQLHSIRKWKKGDRTENAVIIFTEPLQPLHSCLNWFSQEDRLFTNKGNI